MGSKQAAEEDVAAGAAVRDRTWPSTGAPPPSGQRGVRHHSVHWRRMLMSPRRHADRCRNAQRGWRVMDEAARSLGKALPGTVVFRLFIWTEEHEEATTFPGARARVRVAAGGGDKYDEVRSGSLALSCLVRCC